MGMGKTKARSKTPGSHRRGDGSRKKSPWAARRKWIIGLGFGLILAAVFIYGSLTSLRPQSVCGPSPQVAIENVSHPIRISGGTVKFTFNFTLNNTLGGAGVVTVDFWMNNNTILDEKSYNIGAGEVLAKSEVYPLENVTSIQGTLSPSVKYVSEAPHCG